MSSLTSSIANLKSVCSTSSAVVTAYLLILAFEITTRVDYGYPQNLLDRWEAMYIVAPNFWPFPVFDNACNWEKYKSTSKLTYDFIIVGAGAAGSCLAARLSENPNWKVALVEIGKTPPVSQIVPRFFPFGITGPQIFNYTAEVASTSANAFKHGCPIPQGMQLGGSTSVNAMMFICGQRQDYDKWNASGATGWDFNSLKPYFKKLENNTDPSKSSDSHGFDGPITVSTYDNVEKRFYKTLVDGFAALGLKNGSDYNAGNYTGYVDVQGTVRNGERCSAYQGYLARVYRNRTNLHFFMGSNVTKILFSGTTAIGVNIKTNISSCYNIGLKASKEVIVTAGAIGTAKLLQLSGVGKKSELAQMNISQVGSDLPVGDNFQDHVYAIVWLKGNPNEKNQTLIDVVDDGLQYSPNRTGNFTTTGGLKFGAFFDTLDANGTNSDIQIIPYTFPKNQVNMELVLSNFGYNNSYIAELLALNAKYELYLFFVVLLRPVARGTVKLRSNDPNDLPRIVSNFINNEEDVNTTIRGVDKILELVNTPAFVNISAEFVKFDIAECNSLYSVPPTRDYLKCYIKHLTASNWHPSGTCKMGSATDPLACVDPFLRLRGFSKIRVCDASIFPNIPSGNTQCPVYASAEKAADLIKATYA